MLQREKPTARNQRWFLKYIRQAKPIFDVEMGFTRHADDFVTLTTRKQDNVFDGDVAGPREFAA